MTILAARYRILCWDCGQRIGQTDDPDEALDILNMPTDHNPGVIGRGLINRWRFWKAERARSRVTIRDHDRNQDQQVPAL